MAKAMATVRETLSRTGAGLVFVAAALFTGSTNAPAQNVDLERQILRSLMAPANGVESSLSKLRK
jgi:hypothetical protein